MLTPDPDPFRRSRIIRTIIAAGFAVLVLVFARWNAAAAAAFCSCGYTSKEVRAWNNNYLATSAGQARIDTAVTHEVLVNPHPRSRRSSTRPAASSNGAREGSPLTPCPGSNRST